MPTGAYIRTPEMNRKMSLSTKGILKSPRSAEHNRNLGLALKGKIPWITGRKHTEETKIKMRRNNSNRGKKLSEEHKEKIRKGIMKRYDIKGRKKHERYIHIRDKKYLQWRSNVFNRDSWTCQTCDKRGCYLEVHHIKSWSKYPELRYILENGVTLCLDCHKLTNNYKNNNHEE